MANKLVNFLKQNKELGQPIHSEVNADSGEATIWLYDVISDFWGISARDFNKELMSIEADTVHLRINSPGGDVYEARAIQSGLAQSGKKVIVHIDGLAASAATYIALAGDEIEMADGAWFMIHNAWTFMAGDKNDLMAEAETLERIDTSLRKDYTTKSGATDEQVREWMDAETWFTADEAKENGFITSVVSNVKAPAANAWNLTQYGNVPQALGTTPPKAPVKQTSSKETKMDGKVDEKMAAMEQRLAEAEARAEASAANEKAAAEKMAEYEARVEEMARTTMSKDLTNRVGEDEAELIMSFYGKLDSKDMEALTAKFESLQAKINELGATKGSDAVTEESKAYAYADIQKYATEHGISFMAANRALHEKE